MDITAFLRKILPAAGVYCASRLVGGYFRNQPCDSIEELAANLLAYDAQGVAAYHACASYRERTTEETKDGKTSNFFRRRQVNVRAVKAFWMDLDVKPGVATAFESQEAAIDGLVAFCEASELPTPLVISSGGGIHVYWTLTEEIGPDAWKQTAENLKALCARLEFRADPACTGDSARVLRSVGTYNRKGAEPRPVELVANADPVQYVSFHGQLLAALAQHGVKPVEVTRVRETEGERINAAFSIQQDFPPCSAAKVADRCQQMRVLREKRGDVPEPYWYAGIQLMCAAQEGDELIHEWSKGYAGYSAEETNAKIAQVRRQALGPTLCSTFAGRNPGGCDGCPHQGKINSPAQLGATPKNDPAPTVTLPALTPSTPLVQVTLPAAPAPFARSATGVWMEEDGIQHKVYDYDLFPCDVLYDESVGHEVVCMRHLSPQGKWAECSVRSALLARPVDFEMALRDNHIQPLSKQRMVLYMESYLRELKRTNAVRRLYRSMGWKATREFVLGSNIYQPDGKVEQAGHSQKSGGFLGGFEAKGDLDTWRMCTEVLDKPGMEPYKFMLLCGFAAPLLELGGLEGFTVSALGDTGIGKSTMGKFMASIYGSPKETWIGGMATANARAERLGAYNSIPAYMDEITTILPKDLRELIYMIPTGKAKDALDRNRGAREAAKWQTILVVSTNDSLHSKLQLEKANAEAEGMRLFEFDFVKAEGFGQYARMLHGLLDQHYGVAGPAYIHRLVQEQDQHRRAIVESVIEIEQAFGMQEKERFWAQAAALALYGGRLAREWGIISFDPEQLRPWLKEQIDNMRTSVTGRVKTASEVIGQFLDQHIGERLVVTKLNEGMGSATNTRPTRGELSVRYERDVETIWIDQKKIERWLSERHINYKRLAKELKDAGILINHADGKVLGAGTDLSSGKQVMCWKLWADRERLKQPKVKEAA